MGQACTAGLPFVTRVALLACVCGLAFIVCLWWFPALVPACLCIRRLLQRDAIVAYAFATIASLCDPADADCLVPLSQIMQLLNGTFACTPCPELLPCATCSARKCFFSAVRFEQTWGRCHNRIQQVLQTMKPKISIRYCESLTIRPYLPRLAVQGLYNAPGHRGATSTACTTYSCLSASSSRVGSTVPCTPHLSRARSAAAEQIGEAP